MLGLGNLQGKTHWIGAKPDHLGFRRQQKIGTGSVHSTWRRSQYFIYIYIQYKYNTMQCNAMQCNAMPYHTIPYHTYHTYMHACMQTIHTYIHPCIALHCITLHYIQTYIHTPYYYVFKVQLLGVSSFNGLIMVDSVYSRPCSHPNTS